MKSLLISALIVAALVVILYRSLKRDLLPSSAPPPTVSATYLKRCLAVVESQMRAPEAETYCRCLWGKGVTDVTQTISNPAGQAADNECRGTSRSTTGAAPTVPSTHYRMPHVPTVPTRSQEPPPTPR